MAITTERDQIRLEIGDNDPNAPLLQDDEIDYLITQERNFWGAAARCCEVIARQFLRKADVRLGRSLTLTYSTMAEQYQAMAKELRGKAQATNLPWVGGMSVTDKQLYEDTLDLVQPAFARGMQENPYAGGYTSDVGPADADNPLSDR